MVGKVTKQDYMIKIESLSKSFGRIKALDNLNLEINRGELLGLIGPNGAGKTTAIRIICCILQPDQGNVLVDGHSIHHDQIKIKSMIGYLPEEPNLYERFKARDLLKYFAQLYGVPEAQIDQRIAELLELVNMSDRANDRINTFSKGLRQRIGIVRALIHDPQVIILDEPTMGLDPATSHSIRDFIAQLKGEKTIILCTHYMDEAETLSDRVALLDQGKILDIGSPDYLKSKIKGDLILQVRVRRTSQLLQQKIESLSSVNHVQLKGSEFHISLSSRKHISQIFEYIGKDVLAVNTQEPNLDDVFIQSIE